jgi:hypothetical protein
MSTACIATSKDVFKGESIVWPSAGSSSSLGKPAGREFVVKLQSAPGTARSSASAKRSQQTKDARGGRAGRFPKRQGVLPIGSSLHIELPQRQITMPRGVDSSGPDQATKQYEPRRTRGARCQWSKAGAARHGWDSAAWGSSRRGRWTQRDDLRHAIRSEVVDHQ